MMAPTQGNSDAQQLRAFINATKREVRDAEQRYDISAAVSKLQALVRPLHCPEEFPVGWKVTSRCGHALN